jgi:hypothetical protein
LKAAAEMVRGPGDIVLREEADLKPWVGEPPMGMLGLEPRAMRRCSGGVW